jgi:type III pantothenate kinase
MLLVMDVGNSHMVLGLYEGDSLRANWRIVTTNYKTADELRILLTMLLNQEGVQASEISGACISSVVPQFNQALQEVSREAFGIEPTLVEPGTKTGLKLHNENPKEVGADRIVNAVAAREQHTGPLIVIDFGTATTFDYITENSEYKGGIIVPGIQLSADALFEHCAKLPKVELLIPETVVGRNTVSCIRSGLTYGYADLVDGLVRRISEEMGTDPFVIATGGLATIIAEIASSIDQVDDLLTLKGLKFIHEKNEGKAT